MSDLVAWLHEQVNVDERDADDIHDRSADAYMDGDCVCDYPKRALAEVEFKRKLLGRHRPEYHLRIRDGEYVQDEAAYCPDHLDDRPWPCADVLDMAAVYKDRPGYDEAVKPGE